MAQQIAMRNSFSSYTKVVSFSSPLRSFRLDAFRRSSFLLSLRSCESWAKMSVLMMGTTVE